MKSYVLEFLSCKISQGEFKVIILVFLQYPNDIYQISRQSINWFQRRRMLPWTDMSDTLVMWAGLFEKKKLSFPQPKEALYGILL